MKNEHLFTLTMFATVVSFTGSGLSVPPDCGAQNATTFTGLVDDNWDNDLNWDNDRPNSGKIACIPPEQSVNINPNVHGHAGELFIKSDGPTLGRVVVIGDDFVGAPASLTLYGNCTFDGKLILASSGTLRIDGPITLEGTGELVLVSEFPQSNVAVVEGTDGSAVLTLKGANAGAWTPDQWDDRANTLVLTGGGRIDVTLVNQAHVLTINEEGHPVLPNFGTDRELTINRPSSGNGFWIAELDPNAPRTDLGILDIRATVTGSGTWVVTSTSAAEIRINSPLTDLMGDVLIYNGTFLVRENFTTQGNFTIQDDGAAGTVPRIIVRQPKVARFNVPPP